MLLDKTSSNSLLMVIDVIFFLFQNPKLYRNQKGVQRYPLPPQVDKLDIL